jgi:hypothetical protein
MAAKGMAFAAFGMTVNPIAAMTPPHRNPVTTLRRSIFFIGRLLVARLSSRVYDHSWSKGERRKPTLPGSQLVFDILYKPLGAGVFELSLRDVPAPIFIDLREVDDERRGG